jgi:hypothetical protein
MSRKEVPRPGLLKAALAGKFTNDEGAGALHLSVRQYSVPNGVGAPGVIPTGARSGRGDGRGVAFG